MKFALGDESLTCETLERLSMNPNPQLVVSEKARERLDKYAKIISEKIAGDDVFYGVNTGFGYLANVKIQKSKLSQLQLNIVRSHACGVGQPLTIQATRALMILRAHTFLLGHSGVRWAVVEQILNYLKHDLLPLIPEQGSVGASGDLAPLSHLALGLVGEGEVFLKGKRMAAKQALSEVKLSGLALGPKEGLSLINGTHFMTALGALTWVESKRLCLLADRAAGLSLDATRGTVRAFDSRIHKIRAQTGQAKVAQNLMGLFKDKDAIMESHKDCDKVQDPYSFRCVPQVHGAVRDTLVHVEGVLNRELNSVTDNPLVFDDGDIVSGGNFHGEPVAMALDFLAIAVCELGSISEQRIQRMINPHMSGLPAFLVKDSGLNSGFMIPHVVAAALVSENKIYAHPASVDSIPTSADKEDHVSMGPIAARKARSINHNVAKILSIEMMAACAGVDLLAPLKPNKVLGETYHSVRKYSPPYIEDRSLSAEMEGLSQALLSGEFSANLKLTNQEEQL